MSESNLSSRTEESQISRRSIYNSPKERKQALRIALIKAQTLQQNADSRTLHTLEDMIKEVDDINEDVSLDEKVGHQDQVVMDSEVMNVSSIVIRSCTQSLTKQCNTFNKIEFSEKLLNFIENLPDTTLDELNWSISENEIPPFNIIPNYTCLLDWMNLLEQPITSKVKKQRKIATPQLRNFQVAAQRPENVVQLEEEEKTVEKTVSKINKLINQLFKINKKPIDFFELILDPMDFGKTIENMLHVSFLVRDGGVKLTTDDEGIPLLIPSTKEEINHTNATTDNDTVQNIITLDVEQWRMLKNAYKITNPMINF